MSRQVFSRPIALLIILFTLLATSAVMAENIAVLRLESFDAVLADARRVVDTVQGEGSAEAMMQPLMEMMQIPWADVLDRTAPLLLVFPMEGMSLGAKGLIAVVPLADPALAQGEMEKAAGDQEADETGVLYFSHGEGTEVAAKIHGGYLVVGQNRELIGGFDPEGASIAGSFPPGNIAVDINMEPLAPLIQMGLESGRQVAQQQMTAETEEADIDPEVMNGMLDLYFGFITDAVNNTDRIQFSVEIGENHILLHNRWLPKAGSTMEGFLAAQSGGLPELARYVDPGTVTGLMAGQFTMTEPAQAALNGYMQGYFKMIASLVPMMEEQGQSNPLSGFMTGMSGMVDSWADCYRGDFAGSFSFSGEEGFQVIQLAGVKDAGACETGWDHLASMLEANSTDSDQEPFIKVERGALKHKGVLADRQTMRFPTAGGDDPSAALLQDWFGEDGFTSYYGISGNHLVTTAGPNAADDFKKMVTKLALRGKKLSRQTGLTGERFAPLETGPGFFVAFDLTSLFEGVLSAMPEGEEDAFWVREFLEGMPEGAGRIVDGMRLDPDAVHFTMAARLELLKEIGRLAARSEELAEEHAMEHKDEEGHVHEHHHDHQDGHEGEVR